MATKPSAFFLLPKSAGRFDGPPSLEAYSHNVEPGKFTDGSVPKRFGSVELEFRPDYCDYRDR
jgi:hypothetical protein